MTIWNEGYLSYHKGIAFTRNPYNAGTAAYQEWDDGWLAARDGLSVLHE